MPVDWMEIFRRPTSITPGTFKGTIATALNKKKERENYDAYIS
jgi:hypothetical protein